MSEVSAAVICCDCGGRSAGGGRMVATNQELDPDAGKSLPFKHGIAQVGNVLDIPVNSESTGHKAVFPRALPEFFIKAFSDPGDIVFDPFGGSGTTAVAALGLGRNAICTEISPQYCDVIVRRILNAQTTFEARLDGTDRTFDEIAAERQPVAA